MPTLAEFPQSFLVAVAVSLGLVLGSFANVVIYRWPRGESVVHPGSHCPGCSRPIRGYDNVPLLSWLLLRGRARCCGVRISARYPAVELACGLFGWAILERCVLTLPGDPSWAVALGVFSAYLLMGVGLLAAALIDLEHMYLPDELTLGGAAIGLASVPIRADVSFTAALLGAAIGFAIVWLPFDLLYRLVRGRTGMGLGDAKLTMLAGVWFGWEGAVFSLLAGAVQGTLIALAVFLAQGKIEEPEAVRLERAERRRELEASEGEERTRLEAEFARDPVMTEPEAGLGKARLPFGPFLVLAITEYMLFGKDLTELYLAWIWNG